MKKLTATSESNEHISLVNSLLKDVDDLKRKANNLTKENKYLKDRLYNLEYRSNAIERAIDQLKDSVNRVLRIFKQ